MKHFYLLTLLGLSSALSAQEWEFGAASGLKLPLVSDVLAPPPPGLGLHNLHAGGELRVRWDRWLGSAAVGFQPSMEGGFSAGYERFDDSAQKNTKVSFEGRYAKPGTVDIRLAGGAGVPVTPFLRLSGTAGLSYLYRLAPVLNLSGSYVSSEWTGSLWSEVDKGPLNSLTGVDAYLPLGSQVSLQGDWLWDSWTLSLGLGWYMESWEELFRGFLPRQGLTLGLTAFYRL